MMKYTKLAKRSLCKVLIISHEFPPKLGGAGTVASLLFQALEKNIDIEVSALVGCNSENNDNDNITVNYSHPKLWPFSYKKYFGNIDNYDAIICNDSVSIYLAGRYFSDKQLDKVICFVHGAEKYLDNRMLIPNLISFERYYRRAIESAKLTNFVSYFIKDYFEEHYKVTPNNSTVIYTGIESDMQPIKIKTIINNEFKFFTACRIVREKGLVTKLSLLAKLCELNDVTINWTIAGEGKYLEEFKSIVSRYTEVESNLQVVFLGRINRDELSNYMKGFNFYILLSDLEESFGLSYLEAANSGLVPIGYNQFGVKEAFDSISYGILLDRNLSLIELSQSLFFKIKDLPESLKLKRNLNSFVNEVCDEIQNITFGR